VYVCGTCPLQLLAVSVCAALPTILGPRPLAELWPCPWAMDFGGWVHGLLLLESHARIPTEHASSYLPTRLLRAQEGLPGGGESDSVQSQVQRLIMQAESYENLCQSYIGWCPFW